MNSAQSQIKADFSGDMTWDEAVATNAPEWTPEQLAKVDIILNADGSLKVRKKRVSRKKATFEARTTPCVACDFPLSHQHHYAPIGEFGQNDKTVSLCANCHEIYHIVYNAWVCDSKRDARLHTAILTPSYHSDAIRATIYALGVIFELFSQLPQHPKYQQSKQLTSLDYEAQAAAFGLHIYKLLGGKHE